jgi:hypothetical protein
MQYSKKTYVYNTLKEVVATENDRYQLSQCATRLNELFDKLL